MNKIIEHQNDQTILDKLSAQRKLYDKAKKLRGLRFFLGVVLVVCLSVARLVWSGGEWIETALVFASAAALVLEPLLESLINKKRMLAAQIQQRLDNALYRFDWDECVCGKEPSDEAVCDLKDDVVDDYNGPQILDTELRQTKTLKFVVEYGKDITQEVHAWSSRPKWRLKL